MNVVQHNLVGNLICLGGGGLVAVALSEYFGRLPVIFYFTLMAFVTGIWCAVATSFDSYLAARIVNGFFAIVAQSVSTFARQQWEWKIDLRRAV